MLFIIGYCILGGAAVFGLLYLTYRRKMKKDSLTKKSFLHTAPPIIRIVNFILAGAFMLLYVLNPASFSSEQTVMPPVAYVLFTIFSTYFYVLALPLLKRDETGISPLDDTPVSVFAPCLAATLIQFCFHTVLSVATLMSPLFLMNR